MAAKKRPDRDLWRVSWREPVTGKVRSRNFKSEPEAIAFDYRIRAAKADGSLAPETANVGKTFAELSLAYYAASSERMAGRTVVSDLYSLKGQIIPTIGSVLAEKITRQDIERLELAMRARGNKANTIRRKLVIVKAVLNWAVATEQIPANPISGMMFKPGEDESIIPPTSNEISAILEHAPDHLRRGILLTYHLGLRPGASELLRLTWMDIDFTAKTARVTSAKKGGLRWREVPVPDHLIIEMARWQAQDGDNGPIVRWAGKSLRRLIFSWEEAKRKAGITRRLRLYDLRHAFATQALGGGADLKSVADIMGHATPALTLKTYQHALSRNKRQAVTLVPPIGPTSGTTNSPQEAIICPASDTKVQ